MPTLLVDVKGNISQGVTALKEVTLTLKEQKEVLKSLQVEYAKLNTTQVKSGVGKELAADIRIAKDEVKRLEAGAVSSFGNIGSAATKGFSAIRQLAFILPGLGIAGIFNLAFEALSKFVDELGHANEAQNKFNEAIAKANTSVAGQVASLNSLVKAARDVSKSEFDRLNFIEQINKEYPDLNKQITLENINTIAVTDAINRQIESLKSRARIKAVEALIDEQALKSARLRLAIDEARRSGVGLGAAEAFESELKKSDVALDGLIKKLDDLVGTGDKFSTSLLKGVKDGINKLGGDNALKKLGDNIGEIRIKPTKVKIDKAKEVELDKNFFDAVNKFGRLKIELKEVLLTAKTASIDFGAAFEDLQGANFDQLQEALKGVQENMKATQKAAEQMGEAVAASKEVLDFKALKDQQKIFEDFVANGINSLAEGFANLATGSENFGTFFSSILSVVGDFIISMGKAAIQAAIVATALKNVISKPLAGFAAGFAAILIGNIIKNSVKGLAVGGSNLQAGFYDVGERGRERVFLPQGSSVQTNSQLKANNNGLVFIPNLQIKGSDMVVVFNRAQASISRTG